MDCSTSRGWSLTEPQVTRRYSTGESEHPPTSHNFTPGELPNIKAVKGQIGPYELVCELGAGGMGTVFVAKRALPGGVMATVALKTLKSRTIPRPNLIEMFTDEARIIARISHPYVCSVRDIGVADGVPYVAMDYLVGEPLSRVIPVLESPPDIGSIACSVRLIADLCEGLHAAHELRDEAGALIDVVHRDISPDNLFVLYDGTVRVVDFGIACTAELQKAGKTKVLAGKCAYMSPEQLRTKELDRRSDVWSMSVVLWELLTGRRLFHRQSDLRTAVAVLEGPLEPPSRHNPLVPAALDEAVMHALSRDPNDRPATAREMARELESVLSTWLGPVPASRLGNWLSRLFPGSYEFRRRIVTYAEEALRDADVPAVSAESLRTREVDVDVIAAIESDRAKTGKHGANEDDEPVTMMWNEGSGPLLKPLGALEPPPPQQGSGILQVNAKSLISEWLDEQSSPIFTKEPLEGFGKKRPLPPGVIAAGPSAAAATLVQVSPAIPAVPAALPSRADNSNAAALPTQANTSVAGSRRLVLAAALLGVLVAAGAWAVWPRSVDETQSEAQAPEQTKPEQTKPEQTKPEQTKPEQPAAAVPATAVPAQAAQPSTVVPAAAAPAAVEPATAPSPVAAAVPAPQHKEPVAAPSPPALEAPRVAGSAESSKVTSPRAPAAPRAPRPKAAPPGDTTPAMGKVYVLSKDPTVTVSYKGKQMHLPAMLLLPAGPQTIVYARNGQAQPPRKVDVKPDTVGMFSLD